MPVKSAFQAFFNDCIQLSKYNVYRNQKLVIVKQKGSRQVLLATTSYYSHIIIERFREGPTAGSLSFADLQRCFDEYGYFKAEIAPMSSFLNEVKATTACIDPAECLDSDRVFRLEVPWLLHVRLQLPGSAREEERKYLITGAVLSEGRDWMPKEMKGRH